MSITEGTVDLTREFAQPVDAVFAAWASETAQQAWGDPGEGWNMAFERFSFAVGESDLCRFGPTGGQSYVNENRYLAIEPGRRIVYATSLACDGRLSFAGTVAVTFEGTGKGTRLHLVEQGLYLDDLDNPEGHRAGWEGMLSAMGDYLRQDEPVMADPAA